MTTASYLSVHAENEAEDETPSVLSAAEAEEEAGIRNIRREVELVDSDMHLLLAHAMGEHTGEGIEVLHAMERLQRVYAAVCAERDEVHANFVEMLAKYKAACGEVHEFSEAIEELQAQQSLHEGPSPAPARSNWPVDQLPCRPTPPLHNCTTAPPAGPLNRRLAAAPLCVSPCTGKF
jgi:hypothetical protein